MGENLRGVPASTHARTHIDGVARVTRRVQNCPPPSHGGWSLRSCCLPVSLQPCPGELEREVT